MRVCILRGHKAFVRTHHGGPHSQWSVSKLEKSVCGRMLGTKFLQIDKTIHTVAVIEVRGLQYAANGPALKIAGRGR